MRLRSLPRRVVETFLTLAWWTRFEITAALRRSTRHRGEDSRHVLMMVGAFPPTVTGGVYRPLSLARHARDNGWQMTVFAHSASANASHVGDQLLATLPSEVVIERIEPDSFRMPPRLTLEVDGGLVNALRLVRAVLATRPPREPVLLVSGPPFHTFVAGYFLQRLLDAMLVLDYRDEWSECPFTFVAGGQRNRWWEERCLASADRVIFTTASMRDHALSRFPMLDAASTRVIENGADSSGSAAEGAREWPDTELARDSACVISFLGFLGNHTDPTSFLTAINAVLARREDLRERLRIVWVGHKGGAQAQVLAQLDSFGVCQSVSQLSQQEARRIMERSTLLLLIVNRDMDRYRPGKLYAYLATDTPILVYGSVGETGRVVQQLRAGEVVPDGDDEALEVALDAVLSRKEGRVPSPERRSWIRSHDRAVLANRLFAELDRLS